MLRLVKNVVGLAKKKTGPKMVKWSVTASGRKRKTTKTKKRIA